ncbi:uncharacterized protein LOC144706747 [Wolffia australiana]
MARFCGVGSFPRQEEEEEQPDVDSPTPRPHNPPRRRRRPRRGNPYAARGLDKFAAAVAMKNQILTVPADPSISAVRFTATDDSPKWVAVVPRRHCRFPPRLWGGNWAAAMAVVAVILVCLAAWGRVGAICCTAGWWYLAPIVGERAGLSKTTTSYARAGRRDGSAK